MFWKNITEVLYNLLLKTVVPWYFIENFFAVPVSTLNSNPMIGLQSLRVVNTSQYLCVMSSDFFQTILYT